MPGNSAPKDRDALLRALYDELALLDESPQETDSTNKKVNGILHQLQEFEHGREGNQDQQNELVSLKSPSFWDADSKQPRFPWSPSSTEGGEYWGEEAEFGQCDEVDDKEGEKGEEGDVELLNSHLKERFPTGGSGKKSGGRKEDSLSDVEDMHC